MKIFAWFIHPIGINNVKFFTMDTPNCIENMKFSLSIPQMVLKKDSVLVQQLVIPLAIYFPHIFLHIFYIFPLWLVH